MMMPLKWRAGSLADWPGPYLVSTTRFTYRHLHRMPKVYWYGLKLRQSWPAVEGAVGLSIMSDLATKTTYTVPVWRGDADLLRWVRSADHAPLMRSFRPHLASSAAATWLPDRFELRSAWRDALTMVALPFAGPG